jgi:hypothetical protein
MGGCLFIYLFVVYSMEKYGLRVEDTTNKGEWRRKISQ